MFFFFLTCTPFVHYFLQECPSGWIQPTSGNHNKKSCTRCSAGKYGKTEYSCPTIAGKCFHEKCTSCALGKFSTAGSASCSSCAINEYQDSEGGTGCKTCPNGWSTFTLKGRSKCEAICPDDAVTDASSKYSCFCDDGKHLCKHESSGDEACMVRFKKKLLLLVVSSLFMFFLI